MVAIIVILFLESKRARESLQLSSPFYSYCFTTKAIKGPFRSFGTGCCFVGLFETRKTSPLHYGIGIISHLCVNFVNLARSVFSVAAKRTNLSGERNILDVFPCSVCVVCLRHPHTPPQETQTDKICLILRTWPKQRIKLNYAYIFRNRTSQMSAIIQLLPATYASRRCASASVCADVMASTSTVGLVLWHGVCVSS